MNIIDDRNIKRSFIGLDYNIFVKLCYVLEFLF